MLSAIDPEPSMARMNAVRWLRNLVKRQVREAYRKNKHLLLDALASRNKRLIIAFIWLDNHIHSSAEVEEKVKKLLFHIVERLE